MNDYKIGTAYYIKSDVRFRIRGDMDLMVQEGVYGIFRGYENGKARFHVVCENDFHQDIGMTFEFTPEYIEECDLKITPLVEQFDYNKEHKYLRIVDNQFCNIVSQAVTSAALNYPEMLYEFEMIPKYKSGDVEFDASLIDIKYEFDAKNILSVGVRVAYKDKYFTVKWVYDEYRRIYFCPQNTANCLSVLFIEENEIGCLVESVGTSRYPELRPLAMTICNSFNEYATGLKELEEPFYVKKGD